VDGHPLFASDTSIRASPVSSSVDNPVTRSAPLPEWATRALAEYGRHGSIGLVYDGVGMKLRFFAAHRNIPYQRKHFYLLVQGNLLVIFFSLSKNPSTALLNAPMAVK
jgi:hypothetical protein